MAVILYKKIVSGRSLPMISCFRGAREHELCVSGVFTSFDVL